ncbi:MAG: DUF5906 domain-containing protein [Geminicoccaceae bacterium]
MGAAEDPVAEFQAAMARDGIAFNGTPIGDGRLRRFDVEGDRKGSKTGYYTLYLDGYPAGIYGCWKRNVKFTWKANGKDLSDFDVAKMMRDVEAARKQREREQAKHQRTAAEDAAMLWASYSEAPPDHPYLVRKQVAPNGARIDGQGRLVLAMCEPGGALWSLQTIAADGEKRFLPGGRKRGCAFLIGEPSDRIVIAEGFATGASIHEATGLSVAVAFDAGNLEPVARALRERWRHAKIVIAADSDCETREPIENPGVHFAKLAATAIRATVALPAWPDGRAEKLDFNDLAVAEGNGAVAAVILAAFLEPASEPEPEVRTEASPVPDEDWEQPLLAAIAEMNTTYFVAAMGGTTRIASIVRDDTLNRDRLVFSRDTDVRLLFAHRHFKVGETQRGYDIVKGQGDAWLNHRDRRTYRQMAMIIGQPCPPDVYNLWRGFGILPAAGSWSTIEAHLRSVVCSDNSEHYSWLIGWLAYCVQHPGQQAEVAVVLRGLKGVGKGMVGQLLMRIFRDHSLHITHSKHLLGHFNAHLVDALFLFLDEAYWGGNKEGEGVLKALITERTLMIEPKGVDSFPMPNRLKILMSSNNDWVVPATADERRYFVLDVPETKKGDKAYFTAVALAIDGDELPALLDHLLKLDLSEFDHRNPPHTAGLNRQKLIGGDSLQKFWADCLTAGIIVNAEIDDDWPSSVRCDDLHSAYIEHAHAHGDRHPLTAEQMSVRLRKLCPGEQLKVIRPRTQDGTTTRPRHFALQSLDEHRHAFLEAMNIEQYEWPVVETSS